MHRPRPQQQPRPHSSLPVLSPLRSTACKGEQFCCVLDPSFQSWGSLTAATGEQLLILLAAMPARYLLSVSSVRSQVRRARGHQLRMGPAALSLCLVLQRGGKHRKQKTTQRKEPPPGTELKHPERFHKQENQGPEMDGTWS